LISQFVELRSQLQGPRKALKMSRSINLAAVVSLAVLASANGAAAQQPVRVTERVIYADLDLSTTKGAQVMLRRVKTAVARACYQIPSPLLVRSDAEGARCRVVTLQNALVSLGAPLVTAEDARVGNHRPMITAAR
jgi:UrcA family protein